MSFIVCDDMIDTDHLLQTASIPSYDIRSLRSVSGTSTEAATRRGHQEWQDRRFPLPTGRTGSFV